MTSKIIAALLRRRRILDPVLRIFRALIADLQDFRRSDHVVLALIKNDEDLQPAIDETPHSLISSCQITDIFSDLYDTNASTAWFDKDQYIKDYPDVAQSGTSPEAHFLRFGQYEARPFKWRQSSLPEKADRFQTLLQNHGNRVSPTAKMKAARDWWERTSLALSALDAANDGWIGDRKMTERERLPGERERHVSATLEALRDANSVGNRLLVDMYYPREEEKVVDVVSDLFMLAHTVEPEIMSVVQAVERQGISIITPCSTHLELFSECAASVALAIQRALQNWPDMPIEWIIVNDGSGDEDVLLGSIPPEIAGRCSIFSTIGVGPSRATNQAMERAAFGWFLFLDSHDALMPRSIIAIEHYARHSRCRYLISAMIDIDERGRILRYQQHVGPASQLPGTGVSVSHLKAIHRTAFDLHGRFDPEFDTCQDYEFLLRVLPTEAVCLMPDHLYCHRWHDKDWIVRQRAIQEGLALAARKRYVAAGQLRLEPRLQQNLGRVCIVLLTQDLQVSRLIEAAVSALTPDPSGISLSLVVQGTEAEYRFVKQAVLALELAAPVTLSNVKPDSGGHGVVVNRGFENAFLLQEATAASLVREGDVLLPLHRQWALRLSPLTARAIVGRRLRRGADGTLSEGRRLVPLLQITSVPSIDLAATIISREAYRRVVDRFGLFYPDDMEYYAEWMTILRLIHVGTQFEFISEFVVTKPDLPPIQQPFSEQERSCKRRIQAFAQTILRDQPLLFEESVGKFSQALARELDRSEVDTILQTFHAFVS